MNSNEIVVSPLQRALMRFTSTLYDKNAFDVIGKDELRDIMSDGQLLSKQWLLDNFPAHTSSLELPTLVVGGWVGILARALNELNLNITCDSVDIDPRITTIAQEVLRGSYGRAFTGDMYKIDYEGYGCVVNTSAEHIPDVSAWSDLVEPGTLLVVQSNNARHVKDHVSCVDSADELDALVGLSTVYFAGELVFPMYTRYMVIGLK